MQSNIYRTLKVLKEVFKEKKYILVTIAVTAAFYILAALVTNVGNIFYSFKNFSILTALAISVSILISFWKTIIPSSVVSILLMGFFTGLLFSLLAYRYRIIKMNAGHIGLLASVGLFLGILVPGCAACGIGLVGLLGLGSSLVFLPFKGAEISYFGIAVVVFVIIRVSHQLAHPPACELPIYSVKGGIHHGKRNKG